MTVRSNYHTSVSTMIAIALYREDLECSQVPIHKAAALQPGCDLPSRNLQYVTYMPRGNQCQPRSVDREQWQPIQHSQLRQHGEFRHVSVSERSVITAVWSESSCAFLRMLLPPEVDHRERSSNGDNGEAHISTTKVSFSSEFQHIIISSSEPLLPTGPVLVRTVVAKAFVNSHRTTSTGNWTRCISPAGQAHRSEWYSGITLTPSRL